MKQHNGTTGGPRNRIAEDVLREQGEDIPRDWEAPEDRSQAEPSPLVGVNYIDNFLRPGRVTLLAAEEGSGKSFLCQEIGMRFAAAPDGDLCQTWPVLEHGPVMYASEMPSDEDYEREEMVMESLALKRTDLTGKYYRQSLATAVHGEPILDTDIWPAAFMEWAETVGLKLLIIDTATMATESDPWGQGLRQIYRTLRGILEGHPDLSILLTVHMKKPTGRNSGTNRQLHEVLGDWGKWADIVVLMENDGPDKVKLSTRKRVMEQKRVILTKQNGLFVDPLDLDKTPGLTESRISVEGQLATIIENPGLKLADLANHWQVTKQTAANYVSKLEAAGRITTTVENRTKRVYPASDMAPEQQGFDGWNA